MKFFFIIAFSLLFAISSPCSADSISAAPAQISLGGSVIALPSSRDTTVYVVRPDSRDSLLVVTLVNGVVMISGAVIPGAQVLINKWGWLSGPIVAGILWFWRKRSLRRLREGRANPRDSYL